MIDRKNGWSSWCAIPGHTQNPADDRCPDYDRHEVMKKRAAVACVNGCLVGWTRESLPFCRCEDELHFSDQQCSFISDESSRRERPVERLVRTLCGADAKLADDGYYRHATRPFSDASGFCERYGYPIMVAPKPATKP